MKQILLLGDSIRQGYAPIVKEKLNGKANVFFPEENGRFVHFSLRYIYIWAEQVDRENIDVVHFNNGLWDVLRMYNNKPLTDIKTYAKTLKRIVLAIKQMFPNAKLIFATTTPVDEQNMEFNKYERWNSDIVKYNKIAVKTLKKLGVYINDLYSVASSFDVSFRQDWTHFNEKGNEILANAVINKVME